MNIDSYSLGARVNTPLDDTSLTVGVDATWKADTSALDAVRVRAVFGDASAPKAVESTTTQAWTSADGSKRNIELPRISAERRERDAATRVSVGATLIAEPTQLSNSSTQTVKPGVSLVVGTDGASTAATLQARLGVPMVDAGFTPGGVSIGTKALWAPPPNDINSSALNTLNVNADALKTNNDRLRGAVIVRP